MFEKRETNDILSKSLVRKIHFLRQKTYHGNGSARHDRASGERRVRKPLGLALLRCARHVYPSPSQGTALLINVFSVMGKLVVDCAPYFLINLGRDVVRRVTLLTCPGEVVTLTQTNGSAITSRNKAGNRSTPGGGPESGVFPGQPKDWVSEGRRMHSHRPWPTLGAGQGPMQRASARRSPEATASYGGYGCARSVRHA